MAFVVLNEKKGIAPGKSIRVYMVDAESDLASLPEDTAPGSIAHTNGYGTRWEMGMNGEWTKIASSGGGGSTDVPYILNDENGIPYIEEV